MRNLCAKSKRDEAERGKVSFFIDSHGATNQIQISNRH